VSDTSSDTSLRVAVPPVSTAETMNTDTHKLSLLFLSLCVSISRSRLQPHCPRRWPVQLPHHFPLRRSCVIVNGIPLAPSAHSPPPHGRLTDFVSYVTCQPTA